MPRVFVLSTPDYNVTPFISAAGKARVRRQVNWFSAINKDVKKGRNITYIDNTPSLRESPTNPSLIAFYDLYPSGPEYKKWAAMLTPLVKQVLQ